MSGVRATQGQELTLEVGGQNDVDEVLHVSHLECVTIREPADDIVILLRDKIVELQRKGLLVPLLRVDRCGLDLVAPLLEQRSLVGQSLLARAASSFQAELRFGVWPCMILARSSSSVQGGS
jgi:hypothetical protein